MEGRMQASMSHSTPVEPIMSSISDVMRFTGLSRSTIYLLLGDEKLEAVKCGRKTLILNTSLQKYIASLPRARVSPRLSAKPVHAR
jgi:excisionase family DNA binding protein